MMTSKNNFSGKLIVGLGNPDSKHEKTRHNLGFFIVDQFFNRISSGQFDAGQTSASFKNKFDSNIALLTLAQGKLLLAKPQTYMNLSGKAVKGIISFYNIPLENILIIHDDIDLPLGKIRYAKDSGPAGHNGVKSIIEELGTKDFCRLRIGINSPEKPSQIDTSNFVLQKFSENDQKEIEGEIGLLLDSIEHFIAHGFEKTASKYN